MLDDIIVANHFHNCVCNNSKTGCFNLTQDENRFAIVETEASCQVLLDSG